MLQLHGSKNIIIAIKIQPRCLVWLKGKKKNDKHILTKHVYVALSVLPKGSTY